MTGGDRQGDRGPRAAAGRRGAVARLAVRHRPRRLGRARWVTRGDLLRLGFMIGAAPFATLTPRAVSRALLAGL